MSVAQVVLAWELVVDAAVSVLASVADAAVSVLALAAEEVEDSQIRCKLARWSLPRAYF